MLIRVGAATGFEMEEKKKKLSITREADDIANLSFVGGKINRAISDKPHVQYLPPLIEQHGLPTFTAQAIPIEAQLLEMAAYKDFLARRRALIADQLSSFLTADTDVAVKPAVATAI